MLSGKLPPINTGRLAGGLLAAARQLPTDQWTQGVTFLSNCENGHSTQICVDPEDAEDKTLGSLVEPVNFAPFLAYTGRECSTWITTEDLLSLAQAGLEATISGTFAQQLQTGGLNTANPSLNDSAEDIGGGSGIVDTLSALLFAATDCGLNDLVFHANVKILPYLLELNLLIWDGSVYRLGPYPFVLDLYGDTGPGDVDSTGQQAWIYVSGPVEVAVGPLQEDSGITVATNEKVALAERLAILRFDPCCVKAALVDLPIEEEV